MERPTTQTPYRTGAEVFCAQGGMSLCGCKLGLLTNPTAIDAAGRHTIDLLRALPGMELVRLFAPEHGLRGTLPAAERFEDSIDPPTGLPVVSLHGASRAASPEQLEGLDAVLYDVQDIGHRSYTFISSLALMMETCAEAGVALWVLDRPEPFGGQTMGGPVLMPELRSFIGIHTIPQLYAMTPGEFARLYQREVVSELTLEVVAMEGWQRGMRFGELGRLWVPTSEHIPRVESCYYYAMTGTLGELGALSNGVGTPLPFELLGSPWMRGEVLIEALGSDELPGVRLRPTAFRPRYGAWAGHDCAGVQLHLLEPASCHPAQVCRALLRAVAALGEQGRVLFREPADERSSTQLPSGEQYGMFLKALGNRALADALAAGGPYESFDSDEQQRLEDFKKRRQDILIYG